MLNCKQGEDCTDSDKRSIHDGKEAKPSEFRTDCELWQSDDVEAQLHKRRHAVKTHARGRVRYVITWKTKNKPQLTRTTSKR